jgi:hypothetical protein
LHLFAWTGNGRIRMNNVVEKFLRKKGWHTYYNELYWVHPKLIQDNSTQDYTNYGMTIDSAFVYEVENLSSFPCCGIPSLSQATHFVKHKEIIKYYFGDKDE